MEPLLALDLHCHILPGIDDGAKTLEDTETLALALVERGIQRVVASSHIMADLYPNRRDILLPLVASTQAHLDACGIPLTLVPGAEVRLDRDSCVASTWLTIGDAGRFMLVELPTGLPLIDHVEAMLFELQAAGITPIIAHPERMVYLQKDPTILSRWVERGMLAQGTLCVLAGAAGERAIQTLETYLAEGLIHFMGTDAHAVDRRLRDLDRASARLTELVGEENARLIRLENPTALLTGGEIRRPSPVAPVTREGGLFKKLFAPFKRS
jgi:protein-tyrosine phosphatase